jgi:hypothetical protein
VGSYTSTKKNRRKVMAKEEVYNATKNAMSMYGGLLKTIADDVSLGKALEYHAKQGEPFGMMIGNALKNALGDKDLTTEAIKSVMQPMTESFGFDAEFIVSPTELSMKIQKCPMYDAYTAAGFDHDTIGKMCNAMTGGEYAALANYYSNIKGEINFRDSPEGTCVEKITI